MAEIRILLLMDCRNGQSLNLCWDEVDLEAVDLRLGGSKIDPRAIVLSPEAVSVLSRSPRFEDNPHVIPGTVPGKLTRNLIGPWVIVCGRSDLEDIKHLYAHRAFALGEGVLIIGRLLGHS